jgi:hypothetical protein
MLQRKRTEQRWDGDSPGVVFHNAPAVLDLDTSVVDDDRPGGICQHAIRAVWRVGKALDLQIFGREGLRGQGQSKSGTECGHPIRGFSARPQVCKKRTATVLTRRKACCLTNS